MLNDREFSRAAEEQLRKEQKEAREENKGSFWPIMGGVAIVGIIYLVSHAAQWLLGYATLLPNRTDVLDMAGGLTLIIIVGGFFDAYQRAMRVRDKRLIRVEMKLDALLERQGEIYKAVSDAEMRTRGYV